MSRFQEFTLAEAIEVAKRNDPGENVPSVSRVLLARIAELERDAALLNRVRNELLQLAADAKGMGATAVGYRITEVAHRLAATSQGEPNDGR